MPTLDEFIAKAVLQVLFRKLSEKISSRTRSTCQFIANPITNSQSIVDFVVSCLKCQPFHANPTGPNIDSRLQNYSQYEYFGFFDQESFSLHI